MEGEGHEWTNLEACMRLYDRQIHLPMKQKMTWDIPEHKRFFAFLMCSVLMPELFSALCRLLLCQKALFYASDVPGAVCNLHNIMYELQCKRYATSWWLPHLHRALHMTPRRLWDLGVDDTVVDGTRIILSALSSPSLGPLVHSMGHVCVDGTGS